MGTKTKQRKTDFVRFFLVLFAIAALSGCGGVGSGGPSADGGAIEAPVAGDAAGADVEIPAATNILTLPEGTRVNLTGQGS